MSPCRRLFQIVTETSSVRHGPVGRSDPLVGHREGMRVAIVTESFPPDVNGVANTVLRVAQQLISKGHQPLIIAPRPPRGTRQVGPFPYPVLRVPAVPLPGYPSFRLRPPPPRAGAALGGPG